MTGWGNPVEGGTVLRIPAIQSPNFVHGVSGWAIFQDGTAEFNSITLPAGAGGATIFVQGTTPTANHINDLWVDTANANQILTWNGSAWVANQLGTAAISPGAITASLIAANTITAAQLAAGIIYAGIVNGTTITGATLVADGTSGQILVYSGTPALGNLIASASGALTTDSFGNVVKQGVYAYGPSSSVAGLFDNGTQAGIDLVPPGTTHLTSDATIFAKSLNPAAANEQAFMAISSGKESSRNDGALQLFSDSADGTALATAKIEFGGTVAVTFNFGEVILTGANTPSVVANPANAASMTTSPQFNSSTINPSAANEQLLTFFSSGKESSLDDAALQLFSESADATVAARAVLEFGGTVQMQVDKTRVVLTSQGSTPAQSSGNAVLYATGTGGLNTVDGLDGQTYNAQRRTLIVTNNTGLAASPGATTIFSTTVGVRSYLVRGEVLVSITNANQQLSINIAPPAGTGHPSTFLCRAAAIIATDFNLNALTPLGGAGSLVVGQTWICRFETIMNVTGAGTCNIQFAGTNANDITVLQHSYCSFEII